MFEKTKEYIVEKLGGKPPLEEVGYYNTLMSLQGELMPYVPDSLVAAKGAKIYAKMMRDDQVKAVMRFKQYGIVARGYSFDKEAENAEHEKMAEFFQAVIVKIKGSWRSAMLGVLSCMETGYSVSEEVFAPIEWEERTYWGLKAIKLRPFNTFRFKLDKHGNIEKIEQDILNGAERVTIPLDKVIHMVHQPMVDEIYGESDLRACYRDYWSKDIIIKMRNIFLERFAGGLATVEMSKAITPKAQAGIERFLSNISARAGATFPEGAKLELHSPKSTDAFEKGIAQCDKAIAKACLVPNLLGLSEQGSTGSYAQSKTQFDAFMFILDELAEELEEILNEQIFKQLALWNFGTEDFPRFKFDPLSDAQIMALTERWADLIHKGAAERTEEDENWVRKLLGAPEKPEEDETTDVSPTTALNGQQVVALTGIVNDVVSGKYTKKTGEQLIFHSFPVSLEQAEAILADVEEGEMEPDETPPLEGEPGDEGDEGSLDKPGSPSPPPEGEEQLPPPNKEDVNKELIAKLGDEVKREFAEKPWLNRVNFKAIANVLDQNEAGLAADLALTAQDIEASIIRQVDAIVGDKATSAVNPKEVTTIKVQSNHKSALQRSIAKSMSKTAFEAIDQAQRELPKKRFASMETSIKNYIASRSFTSVRKLVTDIETEVTNIMLNAVEYDYSLPETIAVMKDSAKLSGIWGVGEAAHRMEALARTLHSDIMNKARQEFFGPVQKDGFIQAYEYAAVLDQRTTAVCESLHGRVRREWAERTPPNHMQCRSLLVPITVQDPWDGKQSRIPAAGTPHEGFGGEVV